MASPPDQIADTPTNPRERGWRFALARAGLLLLILLLGSVIIGWTQRERIAEDLIGGELERLGVSAGYKIIEINPERQVLTDIVVGNPDDPDLTIDRVEVELAYGFGVPGIGKVTLFKPRLYGSYRDGQLSLGELDSAIFDDSSDQPAGLPDIEIDIRDGRALIESDYGAIGAKIEGRGGLKDGFSGIGAATTGELVFDDCSFRQASLYGDLTTSGGELSFDGPVRLAAAGCANAGVAGRDIVWPAKLTMGEDFTSFAVSGNLSSGLAQASPATANSVSGPISIAYDGERLDANVDIALTDFRAAGITSDNLSIEGVIRSRDGFSQVSLDAGIVSQGIDVGGAIPRQLAELEASAEGSLLAPILHKFSAALVRETTGSSFKASLIGRNDDGMQTLLIPEGAVRSQAGATILSMSRVQYRLQNSTIPQLSGNFRMGGQGLPQMIGRMEGGKNGAAEFRLKMQPYSAGDSVVELPELLVTQSRAGRMTFSGSAVASGPLPGGTARNLRVPLSGTFDSSGRLSLWRDCTDIAFDRLAFADLELVDRSVKLCPAPGEAIVRSAGDTLEIAAGAPSLDLSGALEGAPIVIRSGPVGFAYPGVARAQQVSVQLGAADEVNRFEISDLVAQLGEGLSGSFSGADIGLFAVPIDLKDSAGEWDYDDGVLRITGGRFTMTDRAEVPRYHPMIARDATLTLEDNVLRANGVIREPESDRNVSAVTIQHDLGTGTGFADLSVGGLQFDDSLQPDQLTELATGIVANVEGIVTGTGRIDWNVENVTSTGAFSSEALDLAALFGPVKGASGTVEFVDLLSLTTAPNQRIKVASVNPGIEAINGEIGFSLRDGQFLGVTGGEWPFMGGTLTLRPVDLNFSVAEERRYVLVVEGLDSALFIENMELGNLAATGVFDGELPIVFDELGFGRIEGGRLQSRTAGNVSYVGELTYEDLSPIANYAFSTLKSLDYQSMRIEIGGPLTGDVLTKLEFEGVRQGAGTKQNFITRQIADLPIRFNVNIRAPFYKLVDLMKSIYDPATVTDPRDLGLFTDDGTRFLPAQPELPSPEPNPLPPTEMIDPVRRDESAIQNSESEKLP